MRIDDRRIDLPSVPARGAVPTPATQGARRRNQGPTPAETLAASSGAERLVRLGDVVDGTPEVRADRVASIKAEIAAGRYVIDPTAIAASMLGLDR